MSLTPTAILRGTILGTLSRGDIDDAVRDHWGRGAFVHHLPPSDVPAFAETDGPARRYGLCDRLDAHLLYGAKGEPGCLVVTTPAQGSYDRSFRRFLVAPHVHDSSHVTAVTAGRAVFVIVRDDGAGPTLITAPVRRGSLVLYPAGVVHTFVSDEEFEVASLQAVYEEPEDRAFAGEASLALHTLPHLSYDEYRRPKSA